ncbi:acetoacetate--CoA ligase [Nocardioides sp. CFH 31398]|uniref:acetoacetate--CoA ligase n=1 Tax=Nocardioides sp. CFH 31398 TaxID=2919579 RepID=UPI001F05DADF|nr:acetoacetate--CoA ligase [Nocardioides sp. CFH 31398]MCH1865497.1 acetoacetate--CoA ligase [Nocardioides sp. CFH 31398]
MTTGLRVPALGDVVWTPSEDARATTRLGRFLTWLAERDVVLDDVGDLHRWSVGHPEAFWQSIWDHFGVRARHAPTEVLPDRTMPGTRWFPGAALNYAEHAFGVAPADAVAVHARSQTRPASTLTFGELEQQVAACRAALAALGVGRGDRVAAYLPNVPEALVGFLATAALGAVWAGCALELGPSGAADRLGQVEPTVLLTAGGYDYGPKPVDRSSEVAEVRRRIPSLRHVVDVEYGDWRVDDALAWSTLLAGHTDAEPTYEPVGFDHPLTVLFSSGTTSKPKPIVHGHGGILLEHLKNHALSWDLGPGDCLLWFTTTSWMMWSSLVSGLHVGAAIVMIDGNPVSPDLGWQWRLAAEVGATTMGASPGFVGACLKAGLTLEDVDLSRLRVLGSAGAPMPLPGFAWLREQLGPGVQPCIGSGGTDVCSGLVQDNPLTPTRAGVIAGPCLGVDVHAWDEQGHDVVGSPGELVVTTPMPSMPVGLWGDEDGSRLRASYFDTWPGVWRHGDWIVMGADQGCQVTGRSDATLNRGGVRLGTSEFYGVVEQLDGIADSLVVHLDDPEGGNGELWLFVELDEPTAEPHPADPGLARTVASTLRRELSPRHVPDRLVVVPHVPRNLTGKKLEVPVKRVLLGGDPDVVASRDTLAVADSLDAFVGLRRATAERAAGGAR